MISGGLERLTYIISEAAEDTALVYFLWRRQADSSEKCAAERTRALMAKGKQGRCLSTRTGCSEQLWTVLP